MVVFNAAGNVGQAVSGGARAPARAVAFSGDFPPTAMWLHFAVVNVGESVDSTQWGETSVGELSREAVSRLAADVMPFMALAVVFLLLTCVLVNHEALLKRLNLFSEKSQTDRSALDQVPLVSEVDLCPDLIVPAGCECILIVPSRPKRGEPYNITDQNGSTVLTIVDDQGSAYPCRALMAGGVVLAKCGRAQSSLPSSMLTAIDFELMSANGEVWADLKYEPREGAEEEQQDKCTIRSRTGRQFLVMGSVRHNALNVTDRAHGGLLATSEPISST
ncbi:unnamed protein product, partial [Effrenium voratum]